jgi:hypothetical protein
MGWSSIVKRFGSIFPSFCFRGYILVRCGLKKIVNVNTPPLKPSRYSFIENNKTVDNGIKDRVKLSITKVCLSRKIYIKATNK